ncbi:phage tail tape measure protein [Vibrio diazotrophicus]|uniref:phage tail tape measure protein n=1 Tax=Vibrio diazotrophicus TaxID=685 RepID=UPI000C9EAACF|nr:phage tail tape measure protein [Vibrio diazotrophicus]PNH93110.1 phage tail tape measure protein [Vibrio diazotrophicus]
MNEKLLMTIGLIDQVTKPLQGISKEMHSAMDTGKSGLQDMATGGAGLVAAGFAIQNALMPAIEMDRKLGEVASLFAGPNEDLAETQRIMGSLQKEALSFSAAYGKSATDFVAASYDIQSAISGLQGNELAEFTKASGVLAAATKADTSTITNYMGTMYGIFEKDAAAMGNSDWVNRVAGMTAAAVQIFKTDGNKMSQAFSTLGSSATSMGVNMEEQMAILGTLQATMGGSEAATKYTAFLQGAVQAQDKLGLSFFDSQGKMLPMVDILQKLQGELGHLSTDAQFSALKDAFGSSEAVKLIQNLQGKTDGLASSIGQLNQQAKLETAEVMAAKMTDQWERLEASWFAIRAAAFGMILPAINSVTGSIADGMTWLTAMTSEYPLLTEMMSYAAIGAVSLGGVVASLSLVMGIGKMMSAGWAVTMGTLNGVLKLLRISTIAMTASTWLFNAALWANPITWVVAGIAALVVAVGAMIYWWDDLKASFGDTAVFKMLADTIDWVIDKLNMIPGIDIEWRAGEMPQTPQADVAAQAASQIPPMPDLQALEAQRPTMDTSVIDYKKPENAPALNPSMVQNMNNTQSRSTTNTRQYGDIYITTQSGFTPDELAEWDELNAG